MSKAPQKRPKSTDEEGRQSPNANPLPPIEYGGAGGIPHVIEINGRRTHLLKTFDPAKARARFEMVHGVDPPRMDEDSGLEGAERLLALMAYDRLRGQRRLTMADQRIVDELIALRAEMPNLEQFLYQLELAAWASLHANVPLTLTPTILVGPPGTGKTRFCRRLAEILRVHFERISMPSMSGGHPISGTDSTWKSSRPGIVAEALVMGQTGNPLILLDEIDKCATQYVAEHPLDVLHDLWEREGATHFKDDCLKLAFDASAIFWVCTANDLDELRPSLLDRAQIVEVSVPTAAQMGGIVASAYREACARWSGWFAPELAPAIIDHLRIAHPRLVQRLLHFAMTHAAAQKRREISLDGVITAMASIKIEERLRYGFV